MNTNIRERWREAVELLHHRHKDLEGILLARVEFEELTGSKIDIVEGYVKINPFYVLISVTKRFGEPFTKRKVGVFMIPLSRVVKIELIDEDEIRGDEGDDQEG